jgi:hypothetical protein
VAETAKEIVGKVVITYAYPYFGNFADTNMISQAWGGVVFCK